MKHLFLLMLVFLGCKNLYSQSREEKIDKLIRSYEHLSRFSGSVLVAEKGKIIFEKSYGIKNFQTGEKNTNQSIYRIYSTTKSFTATVVLLLDKQGKLSLQDKLSQYFPKFPKGDSITIEQLLTHTSGIQNNTNPAQTKDEETFLNFISAQPLDFSPGSKWSYSNSNYYLLGYIISKTAEMSYQQAIKKYILDPLNMTNTGFGFKDLKDKNKATGYEFLSGNNFREGVSYDYDHPHAAGAMYSTVEDLYRYEEGLKNFKILDKETLEKAQASFHNYGYGYGWTVESIQGKTVIGHGGAGPGFLSFFSRIPQDDITVIVLSNIFDGGVPEVYKGIMSLLYNHPYHLPKNVKISSEQQNRIKGLYRSADRNIYISAKDGLVSYFDSKDSSGDTFFPENEKKFYVINYENDRIYFKFEAGKNGEISSLKITKNGKLIREAKKINNSFLWGAVGDSTPNGWNGPDVKLTPNSKNKNILEARSVMLKPGELKFRANNEWALELGINDTNHLVKYGNNIKITEAGTYDIILDMTNEINPVYQVIKK